MVADARPNFPHSLHHGGKVNLNVLRRLDAKGTCLAHIGHHPRGANHAFGRHTADGEPEGFLKILHKRGSDQILGTTIVARHAGEMISEITLAIVTKQGLSAISGVIHPYPTQAEAIKKAADAYRRTLLTPRTKSLLKLLTQIS